MRRTVLMILAGLTIICVAAVVDVTLLGGDGKGRRFGPRDCLTILEHRTACNESDAWYRIAKEAPTSDGCAKGHRRSEDGDRCLEPLDPVTVEIDVNP